MKDYYEELHLDRNKNLDEIKKELSKLESTWKRREINSPEKAAKMLVMIIEAREVFQTLASRLKYDKALENSKRGYEKAGSEDSHRQTLEKWKEQAESFLQSGQNDLAMTAVEKALSLRESNEEDAELFVLAAEIYLKNGNGRNALKYINEAIVLNPQEPGYYIFKGHIYKLSSEYRELEQEMYRMAIEKAEQGGDSVSRARAMGALVFSLYFTGGMTAIEAEQMALEVVKVGDYSGDAQKVLDDINWNRAEDERLKKEAERLKREEEGRRLEKEKEEEDKRNQKIYEEALSKVDSYDISVLEEAIAEFSSVACWYDVNDQIEKCKRQIQKVKTEQKGMILFAGIVGAVLILLFFIFDLFC